MRLVRAREVQVLTGLSADQLREWTGRRGLVSPDMPARGKGTPARFSWQTVLVLRLAVVLKQVFHIELQAQRGFLGWLQRELAGRSFPSLWQLDDGFMALSLAPHLRTLSVEFGLAEPVRQLPLFAAVKVQ